MILQISRLVSAGANILAPIAVGPHRQIGTVVDYAYYVYSLVCIIFAMLFLFFYLRQGGYVFVVVCLSVCLFVCLLETLRKKLPNEFA